MAKVTKKYQFAVIASDVAIFTIKDSQFQVLLIKMEKEPYLGYWALPGGLIQPEETAEQAARRHLKNRTGADTHYLEQFFTFSRVDRDPFGRVVSIAFCALLPLASVHLRPDGKSAWFPVKGLPRLAYDHKEITTQALKYLRSKIEHGNIAYALLPREFTFTQLQKTYELVVGRGIDKRNFRKRILSSDLIKKTGRKKKGERNRPAELYSFNKSKRGFF